MKFDVFCHFPSPINQWEISKSITKSLYRCSTLEIRANGNKCSNLCRLFPYSCKHRRNSVTKNLRHMRVIFHNILTIWLLAHCITFLQYIIVWLTSLLRCRSGRHVARTCFHLHHIICQLYLQCVYCRSNLYKTHLECFFFANGYTRVAKYVDNLLH